MKWSTHALLGLLCGLGLVMQLDEVWNVGLVAVCVFASVLPDIDHSESKVGRRVKVVGFLFTHRGYFHSLWAWILASVLTQFFFGAYGWAVLAGYGSHLALDAMTRQGVALLNPFHGWTIRGRLRTGGVIEWAVFFVILIAVVRLVWQYFL